MTQWTDERIVASLSETFAAHEREADPAIAREIARQIARQIGQTSARRSAWTRARTMARTRARTRARTGGPTARPRWPRIVAVAAGTVLVAGLATYAVHGAGSTRAPAVTPSRTVPTPAVQGTNRHLARVEAARVLAAIPVPAGSTRSRSAPTRWLEQLREDAEPMDPSLTRTSWWAVPLSYIDLVAWYKAHTPANVGDAFIEGSTSPEPRSGFDWQTRDMSKAYSSPTVVVSYARLAAQTTAIRVDVTLAARSDRTRATLVPAGVTRVDITERAIDGPATPPRTATVEDPALLSRIVSAFDHLQGWFAHVGPTPCGSPAGMVHVYAVTFHWPAHVLVVDPGAPLCGVGMGLRLDGTRLPQTLADDDGLDAALQAALGAS